jgi:hypothetical protein
MCFLRENKRGNMLLLYTVRGTFYCAVSVSELMVTASQRHVIPLQGRPYEEDQVWYLNLKKLWIIIL